jgi:hypothetical protein
MTPKIFLTADLGFDEWGRLQNEKDSSWLENARFGSTNDRAKVQSVPIHIYDA